MDWEDAPRAAQSADEAVGENDEIFGERFAESGWTTTKVAAKALGVSRRSVQGYIRRGILEAKLEGEGVGKAFLISIDSLNDLRERRRQDGEGSSRHGEVSLETQSTTKHGEDTGELLRRVLERLEQRTEEAADLRARLELTARSESSLREDLERERREREQAQEEARGLREELAEEHGKGFWRRLFGG